MSSTKFCFAPLVIINQGGLTCTPEKFYCIALILWYNLSPCLREYLLEVKVRLLEQLSCGFNSPQLAIEFIQMLLDEYTTLCNALPSLLFLLEPLVSVCVCECGERERKGLNYVFETRGTVCEICEGPRG